MRHYDPLEEWLMLNSTDLAPERDAVRSLAFSSNGRILASRSYDKTVRLWDVHHPDAEPTILHGHGLGVSSLAFSPDGPMLASGIHDKTVRLWNVHRANVAPVILRGQARHQESSRIAGRGTNATNRGPIHHALVNLRTVVSL
jgi:WD40 repeat protein